ncbi:hypothetical protein RRF57_001675 [Xylaria bambusicola]|uniref:Uncharacterized protein n=1 Tax=Xylaria bambusicola TaxID=326684 RepID=A0AAN7UBW5_9PEZI
MDREAEAAGIDYKAHHKTATKHTNRTRSASPGVCEGDPWEAMDWHQGAAEYADRARTYSHR